MKIRLNHENDWQNVSLLAPQSRKSGKNQKHFIVFHNN